MVLTTSALVLVLGLQGRDNARADSDQRELLQQLQGTIQQQQEQLRQQAELIRLQSERLDSLGQQIKMLQPREASSNSATPSAEPAKSLPSKGLPLPELSPRPTSGTAGGPIQLAISGQVSRAVNLIADGGGTDLFFVDNSTSGTRLRVIGTGRINADLAMGTRIEVAVAPDPTTQVSQTNPTPGTYFDQRWAEISLAGTRYGKLSLGKGDTASNSTAEVDLSRTEAVQYASIADTACAMLFREKGGGGALTSLKVAEVFQDRDGLSRQSRLRYDTPGYHGFSLAASLVSNQRADAALFWGGEGHGFKAAGALAVANPQLPDHGLQEDGSVSLLHQSSGLNLTLSGGRQERDGLKNATNLYGKVGWLANLNELGRTAFGVDYTRSRNLPAASDTAWSVGAAVVQSMDKIATELYAQYRVYALARRSAPAVDLINVGTVGARVKF
jgi:hypothetical protein